MADPTNAKRLRDLLKKLLDAALVGSQERPSNEELVAAAAEVSVVEGIAAIEAVFEPIDNLIIIEGEAAKEVNARRYLQELLFGSR